jgi:hypothetical protein
MSGDAVHNPYGFTMGSPAPPAGMGGQQAPQNPVQYSPEQAVSALPRFGNTPSPYGGGSFAQGRALPGQELPGSPNPMTQQGYGSYAEWAAVNMPEAFKNSRVGQGAVQPQAPMQPKKPPMSQQQLLDLGRRVLEIIGPTQGMAVQGQTMTR